MKGYHSIPMLSNDLIVMKEYSEILISILEDLENRQKYLFEVFTILWDLTFSLDPVQLV